MSEPQHKRARLDYGDGGEAINVPGAFAEKSLYYSRGQHTYKIPKNLHQQNREKLLDRMKGQPAKWLVFRGGLSRERNDSDHEEIFRQESYFAYLFGVREPNWYGALEVSGGRAVLFAPKLPDEYAVWMGRIENKETLSEKYGVEVFWIDEMQEALGKNEEGSRWCMKGVNSDSGSDISEILPIEGATHSSYLYEQLADCRSVKSPEELQLIRYVCYATSKAHVAVMRSVKPGDYEYQLEARFLARIAEDFGCRHAAYTSICACGPNSAVLHYGHAGAPNDRRLGEDDMALLDMGAEYFCYCSDVTCSFPVSGKFKIETHRVVYEAVLDALRAVLLQIREGADWVKLHQLAERAILMKLFDCGLLCGDIEDALRNHLGAVFMPHGLGHLIGLDTHDVGGYLSFNPKRPSAPGLSKLRTARILEQGQTLTVEPGCYFIDALLDPAIENPATRPFFNLNLLDKFRKSGIGGVRLEDVVLVADHCPFNLTLCPRTIEEVESVMSGGPWPPAKDNAPWLFRQWCTYDDNGEPHDITSLRPPTFHTREK